MRYAATENTSRKAGIISRNLSVRQDMQSEKMVEQWSAGVLASEQIHYSTIPSSLDGQRLIESRLAAIRSIFVNDPALGSFIDSGD